MQKNVKSEEEFRSLIENISDGIMALNSNWKIIYLNQAAEKILGKNSHDLIEKNIWEQFPEAINTKFFKAYNKALQSQQKTTVEDYSPFLAQWIRATILPTEKGLVIYFQDITSERIAQTSANKTESDYRMFLDRITDGFIVLDKDFRYVYVNSKIGEMVHRNPESLIGKNVWEEFPEAVGSLTYKAFQTAFKEQRFISDMDYYPPLNLWQENYIYPSPDGLSIFIKDISDRKQLEKELKEKERDRQFELMITAIEAQEKERTDIGRELHDNVNQLLVATNLMLAVIKDHSQETDAAVLSRCINNLEKAIEENRKISHELVTPDLKEETLVEQLRILLQTMLAPVNIEMTINASHFDEHVLDQSKKLAVYRIAQEQCTNIVKYAQAKEVSLNLSNDDQLFIMTISDDGIGMIQTKQYAAGIGLRNIGARVGFFGGNMRVTTQPQQGFELQIALPIGITMPANSFE